VNYLKKMIYYVSLIFLYLINEYYGLMKFLFRVKFIRKWLVKELSEGTARSNPLD